MFVHSRAVARAAATLRQQGQPLGDGAAA